MGYSLKYIPYGLFLILVPVLMQGMDQNKVKIPVVVIDGTLTDRRHITMNVTADSTLVHILHYYKVNHGNIDDTIYKVDAGNEQGIRPEFYLQYRIRRHPNFPHIIQLVNQAGSQVNAFTPDRPLYLYVDSRNLRKPQMD